MNKISQLLLSLFLFSSLSYAEGPDAKKYESGVNSSIAKQGNIIVEAHSSSLLNRLWYRVGVIKKDKISWGKSHYYDSGTDPSIAIYNNTVVEVHQSEGYEELWYHVGTIDVKNKTISWGDSHLYDNGVLPKAALNKDFIVTTQQYNEYDRSYSVGVSSNNQVSVYSTVKTTNHVYYKTGVINHENYTIDWLYRDFYDKGVNPTVAIHENNVVEAHAVDDKIFSKVGTLLDTGIIQWRSSHLLGRGAQPSLAIEDNVVVEMHTSEFYNRLWYHIGKLNRDNGALIWSPSVRYNRGVKPAIALNNGTLVETHTGDILNNLYQNSGFIEKDESKIIWQSPLAKSYYRNSEQ